MDDAPDVADEDTRQQRLAKADHESIAVEPIMAAAGRDHGAETRCEGNAVKDAAD